MPYRVTRDDLKRGTKVEAKEHPELSERNQRRVARDHLEKYGPAYYNKNVEQINEKIIERTNEKMGKKPMKRKMTPKPYNPMTDGLPKSARRLPF